MERLIRWFALLLVVLAIGCDQRGGSSAPATTNAPPPPPASASSAKAALNDMANSGTLGSSVMAVESHIADIRKTDAAKADALAKDLEQLRALSGDPNALKAKAKELAGKL